MTTMGLAVRWLLAGTVALFAYEGCKATEPVGQNCTKKANSCVCTPGKPIACNCYNDSGASHTQLCGSDGRSAATECDCPPDVNISKGCPNSCRSNQTCVNEECVNDADPTKPTGGGGKDSGDTCPSAVTLDATGDTQQGDTSQGKVPTTATCGKKGNVYAFRSSDDGKVTVTATSSVPTLNLMLSVSARCSDGGDEASCRDLAGPGASETLTFSLQGGRPYYVFVNAKDDQDGAYVLDTKFASDAACTSPDCDPTALAQCGHSIKVAGRGLSATCDARPNSCLPSFCQNFKECCDSDQYKSAWTFTCVANASRACVNTNRLPDS